MTPIVSARGLGKEYRIGGPGAPFRTIRETISDVIKAPGRLLRPAPPPPSFFALRDVAFDINPGEAVGVIGRNGAGKSTLLKILSQITPPSLGEVRLRGRVAALLEVGTGFHAELTGRENIYLNGAIMGMRRDEVRRRFDEIVAFAEVDRFLDTPVKRYSSGMYGRLAFAVAAHLQPDILVVDEVLAVGDAAFQKKCLGKMESAAQSGRTVFFVSHNMAAVARLCRRALLLKDGRLVDDGPVSRVVGEYLSGTVGDSPVAVDFEQGGRPPGNEHVRLLAARVRSPGMESAAVDIRRPVEVDVDYEVLREHFPLHPNIHVYSDEGVCAFITSDVYDPGCRAARPPGRYRATLSIPGNFLSEGLFSLDVNISTMVPTLVHVAQKGLLAFQVVDPGEGDSTRGNYAGHYPGAVRPMLPWRTAPLDPPAGGARNCQ